MQPIYTIKFHIKCSKAIQQEMKQKYIDLGLYLRGYTGSLPQIRFFQAGYGCRMTLSYFPSVSPALLLFTKQSLPLSLKCTLDILAIRAGEAHCSCFPFCLFYTSISHWGPKRQNIDWFWGLGFFPPKWLCSFLLCYPGGFNFLLPTLM